MLLLTENERDQLAEQRERRRTAELDERSVSRALAQVPAAATRGALRGGHFAGADRHHRRPWQLARALCLHQVCASQTQLRISNGTEKPVTVEADCIFSAHTILIIVKFNSP